MVSLLTLIINLPFTILQRFLGVYGSTKFEICLLFDYLGFVMAIEYLLCLLFVLSCVSMSRVGF